MQPAPLTIENRTPADNATGGLRLGLVRADGLRTGARPDGLDAAIGALAPDLDAAREARRLAARDMLRNGRYKPTGRGKPASEYLLRAVGEGAFPRINAPVDVTNLVSAEAALPISLWDLDRAEAEHFVFRLGAEGEAYVFNASGQALDLHDLVVGCRVRGGAEEPIVSPIKDGHATKTAPDTRRVAACVYAPASAVGPDELRALCTTFAGWLARCGSDVDASTAIAAPGETVSL